MCASGLVAAGVGGALAAALARQPDKDRVFVTRSSTEEGLESLRDYLCRTASTPTVDAGGPLRTASQASVDAIRRAIAAAAMAPGLAAAELQVALRAMHGIAGEHSLEQWLDRIYVRCCLGKGSQTNPTRRLVGF